MDMEKRLSLLRRPRGPADVVLDTDTYNEIDDQYALSYLALSGDELNLKAVYAAPFSNRRAETPEKGMDLSYQEILKVLTLLGREDMKASVYRGSVSYLPDENTPVVSEAARDLAQRAMEYTPESPLYVVAIAAITNVASALLLNPAIADRITVIWLGGHSFDWPNNHEFNCYQDVAAARVVMDRAAVVLLPCMGVVSSFATTKPELEYWLKGQNPLCDYLYEVTVAESKESHRGRCWSKPIWDVCAVAWLLSGGFTEDRLEPAPIPEYDDRWAFDRTRPLIRYVYRIHRDRLFEDLFMKLRGLGAAE